MGNNPGARLQLMAREVSSVPRCPRSQKRQLPEQAAGDSEEKQSMQALMGERFPPQSRVLPSAPGSSTGKVPPVQFRAAVWRCGGEPGIRLVLNQRSSAGLVQAHGFSCPCLSAPAAPRSVRHFDYHRVKSIK